MKAGTPRAPALTPKKRCAIYTRKSTDEGLDQEYNSLEAQRDSALAFISSQRHEGWLAIGDGYDDGGFSGGNINRPSLKRLLTDVEDGRVDVVVVYKIDRLSRSLADFAKIIDLFDRQGVTFVSVTQQFNTTTSMGRLTLNILLSFAQFEREVTGERIRDKIAASKAKGMWMGGTPPLGYDVRDRKLVVNEHEAALVRDIFARYAETGSAAQLVRELQIEGQTTKVWVAQNGRRHEGKVLDQQCLFTMLRNRLYLGEMTHKGQTFPGQHEAIVSQELWAAVQAVVDERKRGPRTQYKKEPALLTGLLYAPDGQRMLPTFTQKKNGKRYRYYVPYLEKRQTAGATRDANRPSIGPLPALEIEAAVLAQVHKALQEPEMIVGVWQAGMALRDKQDLDEPTVLVAMRQMSQVWENLFPIEQHRIMRLLVERVQLHEDGLDIIWRDDSWQRFRRELERQPFVAEQREAELAGRDEEMV
ncbi:recombinase family protein [Ramlibacter sp. AW1]|uniref:Recombinase family protein n=1 Tax=Ramlibacter aurantiacus TaxID=2801330 RepID=A0A936ZJQ1_9BURK|nr:recombinase family protein [Ramlibacter aurantiacus]MBL0422604.1 recombinase family protein [Ramlibacter aurantiacus]